MDNMALSWDLPAEDEIATTVLTGGTSPYSAIVLPREFKQKLRKLFTFGWDGPCRESPSKDRSDSLSRQFLEWKRCFLSFMKKVGDGSPGSLTCLTQYRFISQVTFWHSMKDLTGTEKFKALAPKPLLIKSPVHTARIGLFLDMFPRARFIYIHRHPHHVFLSAAHSEWSYLEKD